MNTITLQLEELPTNINDHIKSCLIWLPMVLGPILGFTFPELISIRNNKPNKTKDDNLENKLINSIINNKSFPLPKWLKYFSLISICILVLAFAYKGTISDLIFALIIVLPVFILLCAIIWWLFMHPMVFTKGYNKYWKAAMLLPAVLMFIFWLGYVGGKMKVAIKYKDYKISTKDNSFNKTPVRIIRTYDKYVFIAYSTQQLAFLPHADISKYEISYSKFDTGIIKKITFSDIKLLIKYLFEGLRQNQF